MELVALTTFLIMGVGLGLLHAFDPDHVAAVGGISVAEGPRAPHWRFAMHWSLGHGTAMILLAGAVFILGTAIPAHLSELAEKSVAYMLMGIGLFSIWRFYTGIAAGEPAQVQTERLMENESSRRITSAPLVGLIHGTAGSAPLLAIIPITQLQQPLLGVVYVLLFSVGVALGMLVLGTLLAQTFKQVGRVGALYQGLVQLSVGVFACILGIFLVLQ